MSRIYLTIVNRGKADSVMNQARSMGIKEGTVFLGEGTVRSKVLEPLGLNQTQKEIVMLPVTKEQDEVLHKVISEKFHFDQRNKGIAFSIPFKKWTKESKKFSLEENEFSYSLIMTIVEKGESRDIIKAARKAKARGGTIIHGRGAGVPQDFYFPIQVEPQKDTVLIVIQDDKKEKVQKAIEQVIDKDTDGIIFTLPVVTTSGIFEERIENKLSKIKGGRE